MSSPCDLSQLVEDLRHNFEEGVISSLESRTKQLKQLHLMFANHEDELYEALHKDLGKNRCGGQKLALGQKKYITNKKIFFYFFLQFIYLYEMS